MNGGDQRAIWRQLADDLRAQISGGWLSPGTALPSVSAAARQWAVTRDTARGVYHRLAEEGLITADRPPRVADLRPRIVHLVRTIDRATAGEGATAGADSWRWDVLHAGEQPGLTVALLTEPASAEVARRLEIPAGRRVRRRHNERQTDGRPDSVVDLWFPADVAETGPLARPEAFTRGAVPYLEEKLGPLDHQAQMRARPPTPQEAASLAIAAGWPVLEVWRTSRAAGGRVVVAGRVVYPADRTLLELDLWPDRRTVSREAEALPLAPGCER